MELSDETHINQIERNVRKVIYCLSVLSKPSERGSVSCTVYHVSLKQKRQIYSLPTPQTNVVLTGTHSNHGTTELYEESEKDDYTR